MKFCLKFFIVVGLLCFLRVHGSIDIHVSPTGSDSNSGTSSTSPFQTIERSISFLKSQTSFTGATIYLHSGTYSLLNSTIELTGANFPLSSTSNPIKFTSVAGEEAPKLSGGIHLKPSLFRKVTSSQDPTIWPRLDSKAQGNLLVTDLYSQGVSEFGSHSIRGFGKGLPTAAPLELFCGGKRMTLSRWPNKGFTATTNISNLASITMTGTTSPDVSGVYINNGTQDGQPWFYKKDLVNGIQYYLYRYSWNYNGLNTAWFLCQNENKNYPDSSKPFWYVYNEDLTLLTFGGTGSSGTIQTFDILNLYKGFSYVIDTDGVKSFTYQGTRPLRWTNAKELWFTGFWKYLWADTSVPGMVSASEKTIYLNASTTYGIVQRVPWFAFNLVEEIDEPNEWFLDRTTGKLYLYPPTNGYEQCWVSQTTKPMVKLTSISGVEFNGIVFKYSRAQTFVTITSGSNNTFKNCKFLHAGLTFASVSGTRNGFTGCDMYDSANRAVSLSGGSRKDLIDSLNFVIDCHIWSFAQIDMTYTPATLLSGCGNIVRHNHFHDAKHTAVLYSGNEHKIEYNEINDVCQYSSDAGSVYTGRDWGYRGNQINFNFFHDIIGFDSGSYVQAVYIDDAASGMTVHGNIMYNIHGYATMDSGGRDNIFTNNIIVKANCATQTDRRAMTSNNDTGSDWNLLWRLTNDGIQYQQEPWKSRYPKLAAIPSDYAVMIQGNWRNPEGVVFSCNAMWNNRALFCEGGWGGSGGFSYYEEIANNLNNTDPLFVDLANFNMNLQSNSPVRSMSCFTQIPFDDIGLITVHSDDTEDHESNHNVVGSSDTSNDKTANSSSIIQAMNLVLFVIILFITSNN